MARSAAVSSAVGSPVATHGNAPLPLSSVGGRKRGAPTAHGSRHQPAKKKKKLERGNVRAAERWCRACVQRLARDRRHRCVDQLGSGARCCDCADQNHTCLVVPRAAAATVRAAVDAAAVAADEEEDSAAASAAAVAAAAAQRLLRSLPAAAASSAAAAPANAAIPDWAVDFLEIGSRIATALEELVRIMGARNEEEGVDNGEEEGEEKGVDDGEEEEERTADWALVAGLPALRASSVEE